MSIIKLLGFSPEEEKHLRERISATQWQTVALEEIGTLPSNEELWLVHVAAASDYQDRLRQLNYEFSPYALLWVPAGNQPLAFEDWGEDFYDQLKEGEELDWARLERAASCPQSLSLGERVEDIPVQWFAELTELPDDVLPDNLPFSEEEKEHLAQCAACHEEASIQIQRRAALRWQVLCPSVEELSAWIEGEPDSEFESHLQECPHCQEIVARQIGLWETMELIPAQVAETKRAAAHLQPRSPSPSRAAITLDRQPQQLLSVSLPGGNSWSEQHHEGISPAILCGMLMAEAFLRYSRNRRGRYAPGPRGNLPTPSDEDSQTDTFSALETIAATLGEGSVQDFNLEAHHVTLRLVDEQDREGEEATAVRLRVPGQEFHLEFRKQGKAMLPEIQSQEGTAYLPLDLLRQAREMGTDEMMLVLEESVLS